MKKYLLFLLLLTFITHADESVKGVTGFDPRTDIIADNYQAGAYLIYDCNERHWVCVLEEYSKECETKREADLLDPQEHYHSCAPISKFPNKKACFQRQLFLSTQNTGTRFCIKDSWKEKNIDF